MIERILVGAGAIVVAFGFFFIVYFAAKGMTC